MQEKTEEKNVHFYYGREGKISFPRTLLGSLAGDL